MAAARRSGIYWHSEEQRAAAEVSKARQNEKLGGKVVTEVEQVRGVERGPCREARAQACLKGRRAQQRTFVASVCCRGAHACLPPLLPVQVHNFYPAEEYHQVLEGVGG